MQANKYVFVQYELLMCLFSKIHDETRQRIKHNLIRSRNLTKTGCPEILGRPFWIYANQVLFHNLDFRGLFICCLEDYQEDNCDKINSVAICGGSFTILTGLYWLLVLHNEMLNFPKDEFPSKMSSEQNHETISTRIQIQSYSTAQGFTMIHYEITQISCSAKRQIP